MSVAGGDNQDMMTLQLVLNHIDFGLAPSGVGEGPAVHERPFRRVVPADSAGSRAGCGSIRPSGEPVLDALASRGHKLKLSPAPLSAAATVIAVDPRHRSLIAPRATPAPPSRRGVLAVQGQARGRADKAIAFLLDRARGAGFNR